MRYEGQLLTEAESHALIDDLDLWCRRTGTNYNKIVIASQVNVSVRSAVKHRGRRLTLEVAARLHQAMARNPHGISKQDHKTRTKRMESVAFERVITRRRVEYPQAEIPRVNREPCPRCGIRADVGCRHSIWSANGVGLSSAA